MNVKDNLVYFLITVPLVECVLSRSQLTEALSIGFPVKMRSLVLIWDDKLTGETLFFCHFAWCIARLVAPKLRLV